MIAVFVEFAFGDDFDADRIAALAAGSRARFEGMPALRSKTFTVDPVSRRATNVYLWESAEAAHAFFTDEVVEHITAIYGVRPALRFADVCALVDNGSDARAA